MTRTYHKITIMHKITQNILLFNKEGHILLLKHKAGKWLLPGGRLNDGENWRDGLKRELQEEAGIKSFKITGVIGVDSWDEAGGYRYAVFFKGKTKNSKVVVSNEIIDYAWLKNPQDLKRYELWFYGLRKLTKKAFQEDKTKSILSNFLNKVA